MPRNKVFAIKMHPRIQILLLLISIFVMLYGANIGLSGQLNYWGIHPRDLSNWYHIFTAPFLHVDAVHLIHNVLGFTVFASLCLMQSMAFFIRASMYIIVVSGILVWLMAREAVHIGASGWVYGLWSLAIMRAWYERSFINSIAAMLVIVLYGGMIYGLLPSPNSGSFESHIFGALAGVLAAASLHKRFTVV